MHGWQDNAGSFDTLCPLLLNNHSILCIDLPGHGKSSHYPPGMHYYLFWDGISLIRRIVKHYNWEKIILLGHSLGGALSFLYAACFPDDVEKFISIDMAGPSVRDLDKSVSANGDAIDRFLKYEKLPITKVPAYGYDEMIDLIEEAYLGSVDRDAAEILMKRGMVPKSQYETGYYFSRDLRLKASFMGMFTLEQVLAYAYQIKSEVLNIRGRPGIPLFDESVYPAVVNGMRKNAKRVVFKEIDGTHHLHLVTPERVAPIIEEFLK